jgi:hypothetical protein
MRVSQAAAQEFMDRSGIVRVYELEDRTAHQLLGTDAKNALRCRALIPDVSVGGQHCGRIHGILQERVVMRPCAAQLLRHQHMAGDLGVQDDGAAGGPAQRTDD